MAPRHQSDTEHEIPNNTVSGHNPQPTETIEGKTANPAMSMNSSLPRPVVIPQIDNLFNIKSLSTFPIRLSCPQLVQQDFSQAELEQIIQSINEALISNPFSQLGFMAGGMLMGAQGVLPVQVVGGAVQILSLAISAGVSYWRMTKLIRAANTAYFAPKTLELRVVTTEKMMDIVGYSTDVRPELSIIDSLFRKDPNKLKLALPLLGETQEGSEDIGEDVSAPPSGNDIYMRRLEALTDLVAPVILTGDDMLAANATADSTADKHGDFKKTFKKVSSKPLRWLNHNDVKKMVKARVKWQEETDPEKKNKKLKKVDRKESKIANRVLWIVITPMQKARDRDEALEK